MIPPAVMFEHLSTRRSVREFTQAPIDRHVLDRVLAAATTAPSATNRQPWHFTAITAPSVLAQLALAVRKATEAIDAVVRAGPHAAEWGSYGDFFWQPLARAAAIVIPSVREPPDQIAGYLRTAGADPERYELPSMMRHERCATGAAVMALMLQAHAEGIGTIWMAGPMVARAAVEAICEIRPPWQMLGAIALGYPAAPVALVPRKPHDDVIRWIEEKP